jgi:ribosomal protein S27E
MGLPVSLELADGLTLKFRQKRGSLMGGRGSGGHNSKGKLRDVQCARLDVHELAREGKLKLGSQGRLFGILWFEVTGGPDAQHLVLEFPCRSTSGEQLDPIRQDIVCYWRKAHFGGRYLMLTCPKCNRPARVLYARSSDRIWFFSCQKCADITYQSTMGHRWDRSARRIEKLRARLQWGAHATVPIKPRGMHERTYQRILGMLAYHETLRKQGTSYARKYRPDQHRARGGNAEIDLLALAVGHFVDEFNRVRANRPPVTQRSP